MRLAHVIVIAILFASSLPAASGASAWLCVDLPPRIVCDRIEERVDDAMDDATDPDLPDPDVPTLPDPQDLDVPDAPDLPDAPDVPDVDDLPASPNVVTCDRVPAYAPLAPILIHPVLREVIRQAGFGNVGQMMHEEIEQYSYPRERCERAF